MELPGKITQFWNFQRDEFCGANKYPTWYEEFNLAMKARGTRTDRPFPMTWGELQPGIGFYTLPGKHSGPEATSLAAFGDLESLNTHTGGAYDLRKFWLALWCNLCTADARHHVRQ